MDYYGLYHQQEDLYEKANELTEYLAELKDAYGEAEEARDDFLIPYSCGGGGSRTRAHEYKKEMEHLQKKIQKNRCRLLELEKAISRLDSQIREACVAEGRCPDCRCVINRNDDCHCTIEARLEQEEQEAEYALLNA